MLLFDDDDDDDDEVEIRTTWHSLFEQPSVLKYFLLVHLSLTLWVAVTGVRRVVKVKPRRRRMGMLLRRVMVEVEWW